MASCHTHCSELAKVAFRSFSMAWWMWEDVTYEEMWLDCQYWGGIIWKQSGGNCCKMSEWQWEMALVTRVCSFKQAILKKLYSRTSVLENTYMKCFHAYSTLFFIIIFFIFPYRTVPWTPYDSVSLVPLYLWGNFPLWLNTSQGSQPTLGALCSIFRRAVRQQPSISRAQTVLGCESWPRCLVNNILGGPRNQKWPMPPLIASPEGCLKLILRHMPALQCEINCNHSCHTPDEYAVSWHLQ